MPRGGASEESKRDAARRVRLLRWLLGSTDGKTATHKKVAADVRNNQQKFSEHVVRAAEEGRFDDIRPHKLAALANVLGVPVDEINPECHGRWRYRTDAELLDFVRARKSLSAGQEPVRHTNDGCELNKIRVADCSLVVIKAILVVVEWMKADFALKGSRLSYHPYPWNDGILNALADGDLDVALYNKRRAEAYLRNNIGSGLEIVMDFGESMAGRHFYVLGKRKLGLKINTLSEFATAIRGGTIAVPIKSDMHDTFLDCLASANVIDECNISLIPHPTTSGLELLDALPNTLLISGQNVRLQARFRQEYDEIVSSSLFSPELLADMKQRARNCVVVNKQVYARLTRDHLHGLLNAVKAKFKSIQGSPTDYRLLLDELTDYLSGGFASRTECKFAVSEILRETYGLGYTEM